MWDLSRGLSAARSDDVGWYDMYSVVTMARWEGVQRAQEGLGLFGGAVEEEASRVAECEEFVGMKEAALLRGVGAARFGRTDMCMYHTL